MTLEQIIKKIQKFDSMGYFVDYEIVEGTFYHCTNNIQKIMKTDVLLGTPIDKNIAGTLSGKTSKNGIVFCSEKPDTSYGKYTVAVTGKAIKVKHTEYNEIEILMPVQFIEEFNID